MLGKKVGCCLHYISIVSQIAHLVTVSIFSKLVFCILEQKEGWSKI